MNSIFRVSARFRTARTRLAAGISALGLVAVSTGLVMITAPTAQAAPGDKIGVCHRDKGQERYNYVEVSTSATGEPHGHAEHLAGGNAADPTFPDYIVGSDGLPGEVDTDAELRAWCVGVELPQLSISYITDCGVPGEVTRPIDTDLVTYAIEGGSWSGLEGDVTVTASLTAVARTFVGNTGDWTVSGNTATQTIPFGSADVPCDDPTGTIGDLGITPVGDCGTYGSIVAPTNPVNVTYTIQGGEWTGLSGEYDVVATLTNGATSFSSVPSGWTLSQNGTQATRTVNVGTHEACDNPIPVTPVEPEWIEAGCTTEPAIDYTEVTGVTYTTTGTAAPEETATVTATALNSDYVLAAGATTTWSHEFHARPGAALCPGDGGGGGSTPGGNPGGGGGTDTPTNVIPLEPSWTEPTCSTPAGVEYRSIDGVAYRTEGDVAPGNRVVVRAEALEDHSFADGTVTWWAHTFGTPQGCGGGDTDGGGDDGGEPNEGVKPSPTVKGVQKFRPPAGKGDNVQPGTGGPHAVPTAVAAGLTDLSGGHGSPSTFSSPQLAQALVAGGLLLLVVGGGLGLGRRTNGAHEF